MDYLNALSEDEFTEIPVDIEEFVTSEDFLALGDTPLSENQYQLIRASSQIYKKSTLINLHGEEEGKKMREQFGDRFRRRPTVSRSSGAGRSCSR